MCTIVVSPNWCVIAIPRAPPRAEAWILTCVTTRAASDTRTPARGGCWAIQISAHNRRAQGRRTHTRPRPLLLYGEAEISAAALRCKPRSPPPVNCHAPEFAARPSHHPAPGSSKRLAPLRMPGARASCFCGRGLYDPSSQCQYFLFIHINLITIKVCFTSTPSGVSFVNIVSDFGPTDYGF